jgi:alkylation response protein AidB-like acyl-CoA dehydrogenase
MAHVLRTEPTPLEDALALVGDATVRAAIDTVQTMGGYGYIDEFPAAEMFRDAVSLRARTSSALAAWRAVANYEYGRSDGVR